MTTHIYLYRGSWYWRSDCVNQCGPFATCHAATADAYRLT